MTTGQSFGNVSIEGFIAFLKDLEKGQWATLDISSYEAKEGAKSSLGASCQIRWKLRLTRASQGLLATRANKLSPQDIDTQKWDPAQDKLDNETKVFLTRPDEQKKSAATLIRKEMTIGRGTGQKKLGHREEVEHGRNQILLAQGKLKDEVALLGLEDIFGEIEEATEELAAAIGMEPGQESGASRARIIRERAAVSGCVQAFNAAFNDIEWQLSQPETSPQERETLSGLREPLLKMLESLPITKAKKDE